HRPGKSMKRRSTALTSFSLINAKTSLGVIVEPVYAKDRPLPRAAQRGGLGPGQRIRMFYANGEEISAEFRASCFLCLVSQSLLNATRRKAPRLRAGPGGGPVWG